MDAIWNWLNTENWLRGPTTGTTNIYWMKLSRRRSRSIRRRSNAYWVEKRHAFSWTEMRVVRSMNVFLILFFICYFFSSSQVCCASNKNICTHIWRRNETETILHKVTHTHMLADVGALTRTWNGILLNWKKYEKKKHIYFRNWLCFLLYIIDSSIHWNTCYYRM